ncbi:hypothetical protein D3C78_1029270 [compost metagenome]
MLNLAQTVSRCVAHAGIRFRLGLREGRQTRLRFGIGRMPQQRHCLQTHLGLRAGEQQIGQRRFERRAHLVVFFRLQTLLQ